jgi:hypothetical protein
VGRKIDEIHNLNHGSPAAEDLTDHLKYFTSTCPRSSFTPESTPSNAGVSTGTRVGQRDQVALAEPAGIVAYLEVMGTGDDQMTAARRLRDRDSRVEPRQMVFSRRRADRNAGAGRPPCQRMR